VGYCPPGTGGRPRSGSAHRNLSKTIFEAKPIDAEDCCDCETKKGFLDEIDRQIELTGNLSQQEKARLLEIAEKCSVHKTLTSEIKIRTSMA